MSEWGFAKTREELINMVQREMDRKVHFSATDIVDCVLVHWIEYKDKEG